MNLKWIAGAAACLLLTACAGMAASDAVPPVEMERSLPAPEAAVSYEEPKYDVCPFVSGNQVHAEDDEEKILAYYNYQIILLTLSNEDAVSPADAESAERNLEAFNNKMHTIHSELAEQGAAMANDAADLYNESGSLTEYYEDGVTMDAAFCGDIISVCLHRYTWTGGAHPNRYTSSYLFDLSAGQFIDPTQLAEDPEAFRAGAAALLLEKAAAHENHEEFWEDHAAVIDRWNEGTVQFSEEGMRVVYSPYEIGPYSIGETEFLLNWDELAPLLGESGLARLGQLPSDLEP